MLQGHTFNSFTRTDLRDGGPYMLSQFVGGLPPAMFLFLTGITFAFLMDSQERQGRQLATEGLGRPQALALSFPDRLPVSDTTVRVRVSRPAPASELLRVDILNCMGLAMLIFAPMAVFTTHGAHPAVHDSRSPDCGRSLL